MTPKPPPPPIASFFPHYKFTCLSSFALPFQRQNIPCSSSNYKYMALRRSIALLPPPSSFLHHLRPTATAATLCLSAHIVRTPLKARIPANSRFLHKMSIPTVQNAVRIHETGDFDVVKYETDVPVPEISDNEVLINVKFAGINYIENYFRQGIYTAKLPHTLGREGAGQIVKVGSKVSNFKVGDRVGFIGPGAYAQYTVFSEDAKLYKIPDNVEYKEIAASLLQGLTALTFVHEAHEVKSTDTVLIHAAAGGTGSVLVQLAKERGATVIGTASTPEKAAYAKSLGADHVIISSKEDVLARVKELTNNVGVNVVFDGVGKDTYETSLNSLARKGTFVSFGNASGVVPPVALVGLPGNIKILRPTLFNYIHTPEEWNHYVSLLFKLIKENKLKITVSAVYPLKEVRQALTDLASRKTTGKLIVEI